MAKNYGNFPIQNSSVFFQNVLESGINAVLTSAKIWEERESLSQIMDLVLDSPRFWKKYRKSLVQYKIYGINVSMVHRGMPWKGMPWSMQNV